MAKTVFNKEKLIFTKQNMFLGADEYTTLRYVCSVFDKLNPKQCLDIFGDPKKLVSQKDRADYAEFQRAKTYPYC